MNCTRSWVSSTILYTNTPKHESYNFIQIIIVKPFSGLAHEGLVDNKHYSEDHTDEWFKNQNCLLLKPVILIMWFRVCSYPVSWSFGPLHSYLGSDIWCYYRTSDLWSLSKEDKIFPTILLLLLVLDKYPVVVLNILYCLWELIVCIPPHLAPTCLWGDYSDCALKHLDHDLKNLFRFNSSVIMTKT